MPLSWNEIRARAIAFSNEWKDESSEDAEAKSFWDAFFNIYGISRRRVAAFEKPVRHPDGTGGYIDLLWKGTLLVEHKSRGRDLDSAYRQATDYFYGLKERDLPRYVLVSDFARFRLYDLDRDAVHEFGLKELHKNVKHFAFIAGYETQRIEAPEEAANIRAAEKLGELHDLLKASGYEGHPLEVLLVRLLFCLFADDTGIFEKHAFREYLEQRTSEDGSDLGMHLTQLFQVLNQPENRRQRDLDEQLASFRYVNGKLFEETLPIPAFNRQMRETLLDASVLDWSAITPAIFGSLFQSIMDKAARRNLGAHYTREVNILKALRPLFLDALETELASIGGNTKRLLEFQKKLAGICILDPACGCGNFLVIAYRELRNLELAVLRKLFKVGQSSRTLDIANLVYVDVDQFYGIEIEEFPAQIAQAAMWLTDHQMNLLVSDEFGHYFARLPLVKSPNIAHANALTIAWDSIIEPSKLTYIVGNPPFGGAKFMSDAQRNEMAVIFADTRKFGLLDYVCAWYRKSADLMEMNPLIQTALVSTNSITQGEQVGVLWPGLLKRGIRINFAHRTFQWTSEATGSAAVHCVIIGFGRTDTGAKQIFEYDSALAAPHSTTVRHINPYLVDGPDVTLSNREEPIGGAPRIAIGNKPIDGGNYLFTPEQKAGFLATEPQAAQYFRRWIGADEFLNSIERWCLWLGDCSPDTLRQMPNVLARVEAVRAYRLASKSPPTRKLAATPTRFHVENIPKAPFLVIPEVSSERRIYLPMGFIQPMTLASNKLRVLPNATPYHFGVLSSQMHMSWMRYVTGRLKSDYQYSVTIVYNNFPWPEPIDSQHKSIETAAQAVLDARAEHPNATLADLYDPLTMPPNLVKAHQALDKAVDAAYGRKDFKSEAERVAFLFERYQRLVAPLDLVRQKPSTSKRGTRRARRSERSAD